MQQIVLARLRQLVIVVLGITTLVFFLVRLSGDPAIVIAGQDAAPEVVEAIRERLGLNDPLLVQYGRFLLDMATLDFGDSFTFREPAISIVLARLPLSILLAGCAMVIAIVVGIPCGILAAVKRGTPLGRAIMSLAMLLQSAPSFVVGILLILVFSVQLGWFPSFGAGAGWRSFVLPAITLSSFITARQIRLVQAYTMEELSSGYVRTGRSLGFGERRIRYRHILRNVLVPLVSLLGIEFGLFIGGAVITEAVFAWPGIGRLMVTAVQSRDYPVIQAGVFVIGITVVIVNFVVDLLYQIIDPRLKAKV